ncbi:hypothetical protein M3231_05425 [Neobacillus mesonae]|nr:hypothetical protein [Neobacillus mesonae]
MITANEIFSIIQKDNFFENVFYKQVDWDEALDARDEVEFDTAWNSSYELLNDRVHSDSKVIRDIREFTFKQTFRITQNSELAAYASDDLDLISKAFDSKIDHTFINDLWAFYLNGEFPKASESGG